MKTTESDSKLFTWLTGVFLLLFSLFTSAYMGIFQERLFSKYGKHPKEALYYTVCSNINYNKTCQLEYLTKWNSFVSVPNVFQLAGFTA